MSTLANLANFTVAAIAVMAVTLAVRLTRLQEIDNTRALVNAVLVEYAREVATPAALAEVTP